VPSEPPSWTDSWRWIHVVVAAVAMVATLPGRTHGLGLFTEPLLRSLTLDRESYGFLNLWATLLGGLFCLPAGWLLDRFGTRRVLTAVTVALGSVVVAMSWVQGIGAVPLNITLADWGDKIPTLSVVVLPDLFLFLVLTRGLGQSALSVGSLALVGRSAARRAGLAMGVYACLTSLGFTIAFGILREVVKNHPDEWRPAWAGIGAAVIVMGLLNGLLVRNRFLDADPAQHDPVSSGEQSLTLGRALRSPAFWTFSISTAFFGLVSSGIPLFNE